MRSVFPAALLASLSALTLSAPPLEAQELANEISDDQWKAFLAECMSLTTLIAPHDTDEKRQEDADLMVQAMAEGLAKFADVRSADDADSIMRPSMARVRGYLESTDATVKERAIGLTRRCNAIVLIASKYADLKNGAD